MLAVLKDKPVINEPWRKRSWMQLLERLRNRRRIIYFRTERISKFGPVQVTLEGMQVAANNLALPEARDNIMHALIARGPAMFMDPSEERAARMKALQGALEAGTAPGLDLLAVKRLGLVVKGTRLDALGER